MSEFKILLTEHIHSTRAAQRVGDINCKQSTPLMSTRTETYLFLDYIEEGYFIVTKMATALSYTDYTTYTKRQL